MSDTSAAGISALTGTFIGLSVVAVGSRFCARHKLKAPFMVDDWLMLLALVSFTLRSNTYTAICVMLDAPVC